MDPNKLIAEVYLRRSLWDTKCKSHTSKHARAADWKDVAEEMNTTVTEVRNRWKLLRDSFNREIRKTSKFSGDSSKWIHYKDMMFLKEDGMPQPSLGNSENCEETENSDEQYSGEKDGLSEEYFVNLDIFKQEEDLDDSSKVEESLLVVQGTPQAESRKKKVEHESNENCIARSIQEYSRRHNEQLTQTSDDYHFLMSLLPSLEQVPKRQKLILKIEIQKMIYEALYGEMPQRPSHVHYTS